MIRERFIIMNSDYDPNYTVHINQRAISMIRSTSILCVTIFVIAGMALLYAYYSERYAIVPSQNGVFVFDRKDSHLNYCDGHGKCKAVILTKPIQEVFITQGHVRTPGQIQQEWTSGENPSYDSTQTALLGSGIQKAPPTRVIQNQLRVGQQYVDAEGRPIVMPQGYDSPRMNSQKRKKTEISSEEANDTEDSSSDESEVSNNEKKRVKAINLQDKRSAREDHFRRGSGFINR